MGHPKKQRKNYQRPFRPYDKERLGREKSVMKEFGLKRKKEIWKAEDTLRTYRQRARELQASHDEEKEKILLEKLNKLGLRCSTLEDVLGLGLDSMLSRRLQSIIYKRGMASTPNQARQLITHGHIYMASRKMKFPGHIIPLELENKIELDPSIKGRMIAEINAPVKEISEDKGEKNA
jgi:small subunit ribosomal protein S4